MSKSLETLDWSRFLRRAPLAAPAAESLDTLRGASILVTGAGGSIGSALALRLASLGVEKLVLLEASESRLFALQNMFANITPDVNAAFTLGRVEDGMLLNELYAEHEPRVVFHAAAFKHVPLLEEQPFAAIANNITGTRALVRALARHRTQLVLLSTDKAVEPTSVMGATKRIAEMMVLAVGGTAVRIGNALASSDSVVEVFAEALRTGHTLTVTDPAARRYFITIEEAVNLLLAAALAGPGLFAAALDAQYYIADLARFLANMLAPEREVTIEFARLRNGDKEAERLWSAHEVARPASASLYAIESPQTPALDEKLDVLETAVHMRDAAAALIALQALVPDYTPSMALRTLAEVRTEKTTR